MEIIHQHYIHSVPSNGEDVKFEQIMAKLLDLGAQMSELSEAVDAVLASEAGEDAQHAAELEAKDLIIAELQAQLEAMSAQLTTAMANDAADAQAIADAQAEIERQRADMQEQIDRLEEAFPTVVTSTEQVVNVGDPSTSNPSGGSGPDDMSASDSAPISESGNV